MNREILFRGRQLNGSEWFVGDLSRVVHDDGRCYVFPADGYNSPDWYEVDPSTVGRYTGLTDIYGVKIFEGDILESHYDDEYPDDSAIETIVWHGNGWCIKEGRSDPSPIEEDGILPLSEVIGNVHDNPELLEGGGEGNG